MTDSLTRAQRGSLFFLIWSAPGFTILDFVTESDISNQVRTTDSAPIRTGVGILLILWLTLALDSLIEGPVLWTEMSTAAVGFGALAVTRPDAIIPLICFTSVGGCGLAAAFWVATHPAHARHDSVSDQLGS
jgi:hypothetical protein